jgi:hypothetical protein
MSARTEWASGKNWLVHFPNYISELTFLPFLSDETDLASRTLTAVLRAQRCVIVLAIPIPLGVYYNHGYKERQQLFV